MKSDPEAKRRSVAPIVLGLVAGLFAGGLALSFYGEYLLHRIQSLFRTVTALVERVLR